MTIHRVCKGESLINIAAKYHTAPSVIERYNGKDCVYEGARLIIYTDVTVHVVRPFERMDVIARRYRTSIERIMSENALASPVLYAGQQLVIPKGTDDE